MHALVNEALVLVMVGVLFPLAVISLSAGIVAVLQSIFQVQEQSIVHLVRLVTFAGLLFLTGDLVHRQVVSLLLSAIRFAGGV